MRIARFLLAAALLVVCVGFIWGNSFMSPEESSQFSEAVARVVLRGLTAMFGAGSGIVGFVGKYIRKIGHFLEFALLGSVGVLILFILNWLKLHNVAHIAFLVLGVAVADEFIQLFSSRGSSVADVVLDFAGGITGMLMMLAIVSIIRAVFRRIRGHA